MDEMLKEIVKNTIVDRNTIQTQIIHPIIKKKYPKRTFYVILKKYANDFFSKGSEPRMIGLAGLRGTGKTTLMWQIAEYIMKNHKASIYFFNVNAISTAGFSLYETLQAFQNEILKKRFLENSDPIVLLFDEVHYDSNWAKTLKMLYDEARSAFIVCTGSSALLLQQTADLARRIKIEKVYPFRFIEFIVAKSFYGKKYNDQTIYPERNVANDLRHAMFYSQSLDEAFNSLQQINSSIQTYLKKVQNSFGSLNTLVQEYLKYHNIPAFLLYEEKRTVLENIFSLFTRIVYEDIPKLNSGILIESEKIIKLLLQLALSDEINPDALSQKTGIKKVELESVLKVLDDSELMNIISPYGGGESRIWKNKKAFFMSPSLRLSLLSIIYGKNIPEDKESKIYEDIIIMYLKKTLNNGIFISSKHNQTNPDVIIETMEKPIALEVGKGKTQTAQFSEIDCRYGILVSSNIAKIQQENNYIKLPLIYFLLS